MALATRSPWTPNLASSHCSPPGDLGHIGGSGGHDQPILTHFPPSVGLVAMIHIFNSSDPSSFFASNDSSLFGGQKKSIYASLSGAYAQTSTYLYIWKVNVFFSLCHWKIHILWALPSPPISPHVWYVDIYFKHTTKLGHSGNKCWQICNMPDMGWQMGNPNSLLTTFINLQKVKLSPTLELLNANMYPPVIKPG